jgi:hypothetical protein
MLAPLRVEPHSTYVIDNVYLTLQVHSRGPLIFGINKGGLLLEAYEKIILKINRASVSLRMLRGKLK